MNLDRAAIEKSLAALAQRLDGDWLLVGGALAAVWLRERRVTEDLDLVAVGGGGSSRLDLLRAADEIGLPVEAVNSAADYFVRRIPGWDTGLEVLLRGPRCRILRPSPTTFLISKLARLSAEDLADCLAAIDLARRRGGSLDAERVLRALAELAPADHAALAERRETLRRAVAGGG